MTIALYLDTETDRQNREQGETERKREGGREEGERENSNSKTLILKDNSVRSIWTYLTVSPCYTTDRQTETERQRQNSNSNSKTLILKDSSVRSIWTYLTASPCYTANTKLIHTTVPQTSIISTIKQLINAVS